MKNVKFKHDPKLWVLYRKNVLWKILLKKTISNVDLFELFMFLQYIFNIKRKNNLHLKMQKLSFYKDLYSEYAKPLRKYDDIYVNLLDYLDLLKYTRTKNIDFINIFRIKRNMNKPYKYVNFHLRNTLSNYFITVTDKKGNVLISQSAGKVSFSSRKKQKVSPYVIRPMLRNIFKLLKKLKIKNIHLIFRTKLTRHVNNLLYYLRLGNINVRKMLFLRKIPHHYGQRKQKAKRL